jgi:hypothetical protein
MKPAWVGALARREAEGKAKPWEYQSSVWPSRAPTPEARMAAPEAAAEEAVGEHGAHLFT